MLRRLSADGQARLRATSGVLVVVGQIEGPCPTCGGRLRVQKTVVRRGVSLSLGNVRVGRTVVVCAGGCRPRLATEDRRPAALATVFPLRATVGYDVMVRIGLKRFVHHQQRDEIRVPSASVRDAHGGAGVAS